MDTDADASDSSRLLEEYSDGMEKGQALPREEARPRSPWSWPISTSATAIILLVISNSVLLFGGLHLPWPGKDTSVGPERNYFGAVPTVPVPFSHQWVGLEEQESSDYRYMDEEWKDLFPHHGGIVALPSEFRTQHRLPENAATTPEGDDKKLYYIAGYHQLHCLMVVRDAIYYLNGTISWPARDKSGFIWDHVLHCIEAVRLGLTCSLDPTLINLNETWPGIPNGQTHECRNREALRAFAEEYGHEAPIDPNNLGL